MTPIRLVNVSKDADGILEIYRPYVENTAITFETTVPGREEFAQRIKTISSRFPYLVCLRGETIVGYAYASEHASRAAYHWNAELSIYLNPDYHGRGIGKALYSGLLDILRVQNIQNVYGGVALPNMASENLHKHFGFTLSGVYHETGFKLGHWHSIAWYEKATGDHGPTPASPVSIDQVSPVILDGILKKSEALIL